MALAKPCVYHIALSFRIRAFTTCRYCETKKQFIVMDMRPFGHKGWYTNLNLHVKYILCTCMHMNMIIFTIVHVLYCRCMYTGSTLYLSDNSYHRGCLEPDCPGPCSWSRTQSERVQTSCTRNMWQYSHNNYGKYVIHNAETLVCSNTWHSKKCTACNVCD